MRPSGGGRGPLRGLVLSLTRPLTPHFMGHFGASRNLTQIAVGDKAHLTRVLSSTDVASFADVTGDTNPIHLDENVAKVGKFGRCIVHGAFLNGIISSLLGGRLPGPGTIVVHQYLEFPNALFVGEEVKAEVEITNIKRSIIECVFTCEATERQKIVLKGYAKLLRSKIEIRTKE